jgi:hypothetical protein
MSLPIKSTPVLTGEDARKFLAAIKANEDKKVSQEELARMKVNYEIMKRIMKKSEIN